MLKRIWLCLCMGLLISSSVAFAASTSIPILCYHDVGKIKSSYSITPENLDAHFKYLLENGYTPLSLEQYLAINSGTLAAPNKPILLTFDDGYRSFYSDVFPLLKKYNYPALMAIITSWQEIQVSSSIGPVLTWAQMREMEDSSLVTFASHSHDSHRLVATNPWGDPGKALESLQYKNNRYETPDEYKKRLSDDFAKTQAVFKENLGHPVKAIVWPYGAYTEPAKLLAKEAGLEAAFGLGDSFNKIGAQSISDARRYIILDNLSPEGLDKYLRSGGRTPRNLKVAQIDIDMIYDPADDKQTEANLDLTIERLHAANTNTVFLQAFSDTSGNGESESVYFYTDKAPVKRDIFSHIATKLRNEDFRVYAWMPTLACQWLLKNDAHATVTAQPPKNLGWYKRATPFSPKILHALQDLFADLAAYAYIDGILFQDDLYLNDFEDYSPFAQAAFQQKFGRELTPDTLKDKNVLQQWTALKTASLTDLTLSLSAAAKHYRPYLATARNLYPSLIIEPASQEWFSQNFSDFLRNYDYSVVMAYPYLEKQYERPVAWLERLAENALRDKDASAKVIFKLQTYDWNKKRWLSSKELQQQQQALSKKGARHLAFYPENIFSAD